jgi:hypothetical protein
LVAAVFVGSGGTEKRCSAHLLLQIGGANIAVFDCSLPLAAMFAWSPPSSSDLVERKSVVPPISSADRRREHRESGYFAGIYAMRSV